MKCPERVWDFGKCPKCGEMSVIRDKIKVPVKRCISCGWQSEVKKCSRKSGDTSTRGLSAGNATREQTTD